MKAALAAFAGLVGGLLLAEWLHNNGQPLEPEYSKFPNGDEPIAPEETVELGTPRAGFLG